jgi:hypothetical protein
MEILLKDYNSVTELMFTDLELRTIIAMTKSYDEEYPALKRIVRKCDKLLDHKDTRFEGAL